ncbi:autotransporter beta-domain protein [Orientia chuto str. Dubai]|uniref:Autotransporter beta-domain protein n=1 Tax=Orientia chuto str. Dubai TaxID=1359168 RepID=A0A0F3MFW1_9RICK|nr:autotransporter outer membrane beta-barrel domain-containing protein [Candidatus Orientia mediorientalis]KJV54643.1 autotransporter beta-domain protein [Orientia chuto str. Dubai]
MKQEHSYNIMSSRLNIDSNNNCWNIQGNVFTIPSRQEKNEEIEEHEGVINGAFLTVNRYLNEKTIIGVTGLYSNHNIQYNKNIKYIFDKIDCKIFSLSLNGRYYPRQNVFTQGIISFIQYDGKTECILNQYHSEINGQSYYCDFMLGCTLYPVKHSTKLILSPAVGIICKNASHKFFDDTTVCDAKHYVLDSRVGAAIKYTIDNKKYTIDNKNILTIFELYTFIHSNLFTNRSDIKLEDFPSANSSAINIKPAKLPASLTQVGGAVTIWHSKIGFEVSYSAYLAEKYIAHVGAVSIKANF